MASPNLLTSLTVNGKTAGSNLTSTAQITLLNNPANSGKLLKVNTLNVSNYSNTVASISIFWNNGANISGTSLSIMGGTLVPGNATLNVIDKSSQYYLEENTSLGASCSTANVLSVTYSYEDIS